MFWILTKYLVTAALVVLITEVAKRSDKLGGLIAALPLVSILTLIWLYIDHQPTTKIASFAGYTFWYVVPTLPMFLAIPWLLPRLGFWPALGLSILISAVCLGVFALLLKRFGIDLL